ncbi:MAG: cation:proton antiporter [Methanobacteriaceae archaeon]|jgi:energy-converting hydrogenase B subunit C|nr:cation:proton antiporter [Methanobacteriaceae archaeon]
MLEIIEIVQSILIIIAAIMFLITAIGLTRLNKDMKNVVYARIHTFGLLDIAAIIAFIGLDEILLAIIYFFLAPVTAHAMANAYYKNEDIVNNVNLEIPEGEDEEVEEESTEKNPFVHPISKLKELKTEDIRDKESEKKFSENFTVSKLEIKEDE